MNTNEKREFINEIVTEMLSIADKNLILTSDEQDILIKAIFDALQKIAEKRMA